VLSTGARGIIFSAKWVPAIPCRNASHYRGRVEPSGKLTWMRFCPRCAIATSQETLGKMGTAKEKLIITM